MNNKSLLLFVVLFTACGYAQFPKTGGNQFAGAFGLSYIDDKAFYAFRLTPEVGYGKFGLGLDLNLEFDARGNLRTENFNDVSDYLSIIRYFRYGMKNEPVYFQAGAIDYYTLGHGSIMQLYNNSPSIDNKKIGIALDLDFDKFGIETIYSDISMGGVAAVRGYTRPLQFTALSSVPVISNLEFGASFATDLHKKAGVDSSKIDPVTRNLVVLKDEGATSIVGFDIGLPLITASVLKISLYADYAKILNFGDGASTGLLFNFNGIGLVSAALKFERRWNGKQFIPSYFNSFYEIERFRGFDSVSNRTMSKIFELKNANNEEKGYFGSLSVDVLKMFNVYGSYQRLDNISNSGMLQLHGTVTTESFPVMARAGYEKMNIVDEADMFRLDNRSYMFAEIGYKPYSYLLVSMVYNWTFTPLRDKDDNIIGFEPQKKIEPRVSLIMPLNFGGKK